jgi:hypothetical protein
MLLYCSSSLVPFEPVKSVFVPVLIVIESILQVLIVFLLILSTWQQAEAFVIFY